MPHQDQKPCCEKCYSGDCVSCGRYCNGTGFDCTPPFCTNPPCPCHSAPSDSTFSDFMRSTGKEKEKVMLDVARAAAEDQRKMMSDTEKVESIIDYFRGRTGGWGFTHDKDIERLESEMLARITNLLSQAEEEIKQQK